jgi:hypothetical protein
MRRAAALAITAVLALGACGSKSAGERALDDTADHLGRIRSGSLTMRVAATLATRPSEPVGYALSGPFQLADAGRLPLARLDYTRLAGPQQAVVQVVANGETAWVVANGTRHDLTPDQLAQLRAPASGSTSGAVSGLHLTSWLRHPRIEPAGNGLDRITGDVDAGMALADVLSLSARYGAATATLTKADIEVLRRAAANGRVELLTGHDDRLLRRVSFDVDFNAAAQGALARVLGSDAGPHLSVELAVANPNQPVKL